jgi:hypothetical protein
MSAPPLVQKAAEHLAAVGEVVAQADAELLKFETQLSAVQSATLRAALAPLFTAGAWLRNFTKQDE